MNFNLKSVAFVLLAFLAVNTVSAQRGQAKLTAEQQAEKQTERMTEELSLTDVQAQQVATLNLKYAQKEESLRSESIDGTDKRAVMKQMRTEQETELKGILTSEQMTKLEAARPDKRGGGKGRKMSNKGINGEKSSVERVEMRANRLAEDLNLTDTQIARIQAVNWEFEQNMEKLRADETVEKADKKAIREKRDAEIKAILTPEQAVQFDARKKGGKRGARNS